MKQLLLFISFLLLNNSVFAQSEISEIEATLLNYINGTSYNQSKLIEKAFYEDANLYLEKKDKSLWTVPAREYASWYNNKNEGKFTGRIGNILSIDNFEGIATAKAEIIIPTKGSRYIDLFLLKKIENKWKIISKTT